MSEATPVEPQKTQEESEVIPPKPPRTPEEEAAHLLKKAEKKKKKAEKRKKHRLSLIAITLSVFLAWLGSTVFVMFHESLASELGASHSRVKIALASYSVALIMIAVAGGRIADILGRKRIFIIGGLAFSAAALLGFTVDTLGSLVAVRAFMGFCAGLVLASTGGVLVSTLHGSTRHDAWLLWRGAGMAGMVLGPVFGPLIASASNWRRMFIADALLMLVAVGIGAYSMKESRDKDSVFTFALMLPALLLGLGLLCPYLALLTGKEHVASWPLSVAIVVVGVVCLIGFFVLNRRSSHPLFDTNIVLHNRRMWITDLFGAIHVGALFVIVAAFPVILEAEHRSFSSGNRHRHARADDPLDHVAPARPSFPRAIRTYPADRDVDRLHAYRAEHGVVVCCGVAAPDVRRDLSVAGPDGQRIRHDPPVWPYGSHQADREALGIDAFWHADLQQPCRRRCRREHHRIRSAGDVEACSVQRSPNRS